MNKLFLLGNITRDLDYTEKISEDGRSDSIVRFDVGVGRKQKKEGGPESDFFHCTAFGKKADFISKYFKKGSKILVEGHVQNNNYTNKDGDKVYDDAAVQHITFEDFSDSSEFAIATVVHEIIIKKDIRERKISLFDWNELGFDESVSFGMEVEIEDIKRYFFITVTPDGCFDIKEQELTFFEMNEYTEMVEIFEQGRTDSETVKGVIRFADCSINVIKDAGLYTVPEIKDIADLLENGDNKLRGKERREELLSSCLDIKLYEESGRGYYFVGTIGEGMRQKIQRACVVRTIEGYDGAEIRFDEMLPMMNVAFVHSGQLTVMPFPFKYLREYIKTLSAS